jgi:peptidoglycan/LPS O-acetylase OafA/YrhL
VRWPTPSLDSLARAALCAVFDRPWHQAHLSDAALCRGEAGLLKVVGHASGLDPMGLGALAVVNKRRKKAVDQRVQPARPATDVGLRRSDGFRPDVQALRALAIGLVVLNHLWPNQFPGGYVGVDVFFVISGFLISSHLIREVDGTGRIQLARFYARRVRRLLPAAFLVLVFAVIGAYLVVPRPQWNGYASEVMASALYWQNWLLATDPAGHAQFTAVTSYWSLSVEEQFYLCWPLLLLALFAIKSRRARFVGMATVGAASLVLSIYLTHVAQHFAYLATPVRVWEFAIGALIALGAKFALPAVAANLASLAGVVAVVGSALLLGPHSEFPGAVALIPAVGTGLIIAAGTRPIRQWHNPVSSSAPVQLLGDISYSLYLWHWPLIVLAMFAFPGAVVAGTLTVPLRLAILAISLVLAYLSKRLVEDPMRSWRRLAGSVRLTFTGMVVGMVAVCALAAGILL